MVFNSGELQVIPIWRYFRNTSLKLSDYEQMRRGLSPTKIYTEILKFRWSKMRFITLVKGTRIELVIIQMC